MRPHGAICLALLRAADALFTPARAPTLRELANHAQVGSAAARYSVPRLVRGGALQIVRTRRVPYRNRPVAEYARAEAAEPTVTGGADLAEAMASWWR